MASTYSPSLRIELIGTGDQSGTWGDTTNTNLGSIIEQAIAGYQSVTMTDIDYTLTVLNGSPDQSRNAVIEMVSSGSLSASRNVIVPSSEKVYIFKNSTSGGQNIVVKTAAGTGVAVPNGKTVLVYCNGTNVYTGQNYFDSIALGTPVPVSSGGTGQTTATAGFDALAPTTTLGDTIYNNGSDNVRLAGNTTTIKNFLAQTGTGSVSAAPVWSTVSKSDVGLGNVENTALSTWTGATSITTLGTIGTGVWQGSTIAVARGGTGQTGFTDGQLLIGKTDGTLAKATLTAGTNVTVTNGDGAITISAANAGGSVTSVDVSGGTTGLTTSGGPVTTTGTITLAGTLAVANGGTGSTTAANARTALSVPSTTGSGASGTWGISISGNAATATSATSAASATSASTATYATTAGNGGVTSVNTKTGAIQSVLMRATAATPSGTAVTFTGIPSWAQRITFILDSVSFAASGISVIRIGNGTLVASGYATGNLNASGGGNSVSEVANGFGNISTAAGASTCTGLFTLVRNSDTDWVFNGFYRKEGDSVFQFLTGYLAYGAIDRVALVATTSSFDGGTLNIMYE